MKSGFEGESDHLDINASAAQPEQGITIDIPASHVETDNFEVTADADITKGIDAESVSRTRKDQEALAKVQEELGITENKSERPREVILNAVKERLKANLSNFAEAPFHNAEHSEGKVSTFSADILKRAKESGIPVSLEDEEITEIAALSHDQVISSAFPLQYEAVTEKITDEEGQEKSIQKIGPDGKIITKNRSLRGPFGDALQLGRLRGSSQEEVMRNSPLLQAKKGDIGNEEASFNFLVDIIKEEDPDGTVFTPEAVGKIKEAIDVTYPDFNFAFEIPAENLNINYENAKGEKVSLTAEDFKDFKSPDGKFRGLNIFQPNIWKAENITSVALGMADIMYMGKVTPDRYHDIGNSEYLETHDYQVSLLKKYKEFDANPNAQLSAEDQVLKQEMPIRKKEIVDSMLGWIKTQVFVAESQKENFNRILNEHPLVKDNEAFKQGLKEEYSKFDENVGESRERYLKYQQLYNKLQEDPSRLDEVSDAFAADLGIQF